MTDKQVTQPAGSRESKMVTIATDEIGNPIMSERERIESEIAYYLRERAIEAGRNGSEEWPVWLHYLWALTHPRKLGEEYGRISALSMCAAAIEDGKHRKSLPTSDPSTQGADPMTDKLEAERG